MCDDTDFSTFACEAYRLASRSHQALSWNAKVSRKYIISNIYLFTKKSLFLFANRSFFCRMKCKTAIQIKEENETTSMTSRKSKKQQNEKKYCVIQCTGYLKSWAPTKNGVDEQESEAEGECNLSLSCLVAG
jgi:hypothetical protein